MSMMLGITAITEPYPTVYAGKDSKKELCKENGGEWEDGACDFKADNEDKADEFLEDVQKIEEFEDEKAALEDALRDDEDAETTYIPLCKSNDLTLGEAFAEKYNEKNCEKYNGKWEDDECEFFGPKGWEVNEDISTNKFVVMKRTNQKNVKNIDYL
jgi:hypothetical protein